LLNYKIRTKLKLLKNTTEAETSICVFKTGGPSMLGTPVGGNQYIFLLQHEQFKENVFITKNSEMLVTSV